MADALAHVWAKSPPRGAGEGEHLAAHTGHVLARLGHWRERYPLLALHCARADLWDIAGWAALLHDVGKTAAGFQRMLRDGPRFDDRHEVLSLVAVGWLDVSDDVRALVAAGVATHHKDLPVVFERYPFGEDARGKLLAELSAGDEQRLRAWLAGQGAPDLAQLGFRPLPPLRAASKAAALGASFSALQQLLDQGRGRAATDAPSLAARFTRGLVVLADHAGSAHERPRPAPVLDSVAALRARLQADLAHVTGALRPSDGVDLWPHQESCATVAGHAVLRAPTGSGKTEAALLWAARQREMGPGRPPLFYVLPYRASLNAMRFRITRRYAVPDDAIVLQHSSATAALYAHLLDAKGYTSDQALRAARAERNLGTLMTAPVRVLTPYQLLRAFFGLRGHEAMLTDAAGGLFVFDELHAYDVRRLALILAAVAHLAQDLGARLLAMSATFPSVLAEAWSAAVGARPHGIVATPGTQARFRRHVLHVDPGDLLDHDTAGRILGRFRAGEAVLAVATTVARAQSLYDRLAAEAGSAVQLLHGRFTGEDRNRKELDLAARMGTTCRGVARGDASGGCILVATQVVEVSLDLDFDVLFSDPAPLEALLQRFGRVNRGRRGSPRDVIVQAHVPSEGRFVYPRDDVERALHVLARAGGRVIEEADTQAWVDQAYAPIAERWRRELDQQVRADREQVVQLNRPLETHDELAEAFDELFDGAEVVPRSLERRHRRLLADDPLRASFLRVPLAWRQVAPLLRARRVRRVRDQGVSYLVADLPYDPVRGLALGFGDDDA